VLAVGDAAFQRKCLGKMQQVASGEGRTVLFVSHNSAALQNLCSRGLLLEAGTRRFHGSTAEALALYINSGAGTHGRSLDKQVAPPDCPVRCTKLTVNGSEADRVALATSADPVEIVTEVQVTVDTRLSLETYLCDLYGTKLALCSPGHDASGADTHRLAPGRHRLTTRIELPRLFRGHYMLDITLVQPFVCRYVNFPCAVELAVDSSGLNWSRLFEEAGTPLGFMVLPGRVTSERLPDL
jgi:lipopolysaccharide transport system ATP-binding protein